ncbi:MAG: c-type cytochrome, partial [Acidobacteriota bacterium]|nr:c-type cytochrome [Acidobacteriota bacterium]
GAKIFKVYCARCHGFDGSGGSGPPLARPTLHRAKDEAAILAIVVDGIPGTPMIGYWMLAESEMSQVAAYVRSLGRRPEDPLPGDPERGRALYENTGCDTCHIINGEGAALGPALTDVGMLRGAAFLRDSLLDPAAARPERGVPYEPYTYPAYVVAQAQPLQGPEVAGVLVNEDSFTIQLRDRAGRLHSLRKADLRTLEYNPRTSLMPSYRGKLDDRQLNDLVAYLMTLRGGR